MNYEDFCHIATICAEQIGSKCRRFFCPSNFMKFEKDEFGRIAILPFYLYVMRTVSNWYCTLYMLESSATEKICINVLDFPGFIDASTHRHEWTWWGCWWFFAASGILITYIVHILQQTFLNGLHASDLNGLYNVFSFLFLF